MYVLRLWPSTMNNKNINKLIENALAIEARDAKEAGALGYMGRALVQATMPHRKIEGNEFIRKNGSFTLTMLAPSHVGIPYGSMPRLLMAWITTEAVKTGLQELVMGRSLSDFMRQLGLVPTGGRWGSITRLREQMIRIFSSSISCTYNDASRASGVNMQVAEDYSLWWEPRKPEQAALWESTITLNRRFFDEITSSPIPIDIDALKALKKSPMALDIYCWLTYRMSYLKRNTGIPWQALAAQFGSNYANDAQGIRNFRRHFIEQLKKVNCVYPNANVECDASALTLKPSKTHIKSSIVKA